eukprot:snap_masked-scaffold_5-processed-gene-20.79-mRNA-1 protein AED:1.00 eAED:1.00 QI:0/0/0/0/1/1/2/0/1139
MDKLLPQLLSHDNNIRKEAESQFTYALKNSPGDTFQALIPCLSVPELADQAAVLLKRCLNTNKEIPSQVPGNVRETLYQAFVASKVKSSLQKKLALVLAIYFANDADWHPKGKDLFLHLGNLPGEGKLHAFNSLAEYAQEQIQPFAMDLLNLLVKELDQFPLPALQALVSLLQCQDALGPQFKPALPKMLMVLSHASGTDKFESVAQSLLELAEMYGKFFASELATILSIAVKVVGNSQVDEGQRTVALELLATMLEKNAGEAKRQVNATLLQSIISSILSTIIDGTEAEDLTIDTFDVELELEDQIDEVEDLRLAGQETLTRVGKALGSSILGPILSAAQPILTASNQQNQKQIAAALMALASLAPYGGISYFQELSSLIALITPHIGQGSDRCKWQAMNSLGCLFYAFYELDDESKVNIALRDLKVEMTIDELTESQEEELLQKFVTNYSQTFLPSVIALLADKGNNIFLLREGCNLVLAFASTLPVMLPDFDSTPILEALAKLIKIPALEISALTSVSSLAQSQENFGKFYGHFMPAALHSLSQARTGENLSKILDCVGLLGNSVDRKVFEPDARNVLNSLINKSSGDVYALKLDETDSNSEVTEYLMRALARIVTAMATGPDEKNSEVMFVEYLPKLIPPLINRAVAKADISIGEDIDTLNGEADGGMSVHVRGVGTKHVQLNTDALHEKELSLTMLALYAETYEDKFVPFISAALIESVLLEVVSPIYNIRLAAVQALPKFISKEVLIAANSKSAETQRYFTQALEVLLECMEEELAELIEMDSAEIDPEDEELLLSAAEAFAGILRNGYEASGRSDSDVDIFLDPSYKANQLVVTVPMPLNALEHITKLLRARLSKRSSPDSETFEESEKRINDILDSLSEAVGLIIKGNAENPQLLGKFDEFCSSFSLDILNNPQASGEMKAAALFFWDDLFEYGHFKTNHVDAAIPHLLKSANDENYLLRQSASYGLGVLAESIAKFGGTRTDEEAKAVCAGFLNHLPKVIEELKNVILGPKAKKGSNSSATDNAISALLKICTGFQAWMKANGHDPESLMADLLGLMPLKTDLIEARIVHYKLMQFYQQGVSDKLKENIQKILIEAAGSKKGLIKETGTYQENLSILSRRTRAFVVSNFR